MAAAAPGRDDLAVDARKWCLRASVMGGSPTAMSFAGRRQGSVTPLASGQWLL